MEVSDASGGLCPLCRCGGARSVRPATRRRLRVCARCLLLFVDPVERPTAEEAARRYRRHENSIEDDRYVRFLARLLDPVVEQLTPGSRGLDFGSGPEPVLAELVRRRGFTCEIYDPVFAPGPPVPPYDFLLASEVCEHFVDPAAEFARMRALLRPGGLLGIMTELWAEETALASWSYLSDPTHVAFYRAETFEWISREFGWERVASDGHRVVLLRRPEVDVSASRTGAARKQRPR